MPYHTAFYQAFVVVDGTLRAGLTAGLIGVLSVSAGSITTLLTVVHGRVGYYGCLSGCVGVSGCTVMVLGACALLMETACTRLGRLRG